MVSFKQIYPIATIGPLILISIYYAVNQNITSTGAAASNTQIENKSASSSGASKNEKVQYFVTLSSGYKVVPIYERKGTFEPLKWGWGHDGIPVNGSITNAPLNKSGLFNQVVLVEAFEDDKEIYKKYVTTDQNGTYHTSFFPPTSGGIKITAMIPGQNATESIITAIVTESALPVIVIAAIIGIAIALVIMSRLVLTNSTPRKYKIITFTLIGFLTIVAYIILFKFPPFDAAGNTAFAAALLAPIATYIYDVAQPKSEGQQK